MVGDKIIGLWIVIMRMGLRFSWRWVILVSAWIVGTALVIKYTFARDLWLDEAWSVYIVSLDMDAFKEVIMHREVNMILYYWLLRYWLLVSHEEAWIRGLSVLFYVLSMIYIYFLGRDLFTKRVGLIAVLLFATNPFLLSYGAETRAYTLVLFLVIISAWFLVKAIKQGMTSHYTAFSFFAVLAGYAHVFGAIQIAVNGASALLVLAILERRLERKLLVSLLWIAIFYIPLMVLFIRGLGNVVNWISLPGLKSIRDLFTTLLGDPDGLWTMLAMGVVGFGLAHQWGKNKNACDKTAFALAFSVLSVALPVVFVFFLSRISSIFVDRYFICVTPPLILLLSYGFSCIAWDRVSYLLLAVSLSICVYYSSKVTMFTPREDWSKSASYIAESNASEDAQILFFPAFCFMPFEYYFKKMNHENLLKNTIFPRRQQLNQLLIDQKGINELTEAQIVPLIDLTKPLFVILSHDKNKVAGRDSSKLVDALTQSFHVMSERHWKGVKVLKFSQD